MSIFPQLRVRPCGSGSVNQEGEYVLYWMTMQRRPHFNFALQRAVEWAVELGRPLVILEALRCDYPWANQRIHRFVMDGMQDHLAHFSQRPPSPREGDEAPCTYYPYLERAVGEGKGLLAALAERACLVVTDDFPCFFLPRMLEAANAQVRVLLEAVDGNGLLPLRAPGKCFERAVDLRRYLQKNLADHLDILPLADPLQRVALPRYTLPSEILERWPLATLELAGLPIDNEVTPVDYRGGFVGAEAQLEEFLDGRLSRYLDRSQPDSHATSGLSPYLHFGHISVFAVLDGLARREAWNPSRMTYRANGSKDGTWGMSAPAEAFMDQIVTWRELGYLYCHYRPDYDCYSSLPPWAMRTLEEHAGDPRPHVYTLEQFGCAETHDPLWNAAQRQLLCEGRIHNYLRMLWGKKVLEWTRHPGEALEILIELNNRYALDGRDPNSYSGIFWCLGRFDRPWFRRPIFGSVRYMSCESARRKFKLDSYLARWGDQTPTPSSSTRAVP